MQIRLFATLRQIANGAVVEVPYTEGDTVRTLLARLVDVHPDLGPELFDKDAQLHSHVHVMVNGRDVQFLDGLDTPVQASDQIRIFPPVGGGTPKTTQPASEPVVSSPESTTAGREDLTHVTLKFTGNVRARMGRDRMEFSFRGHTLDALLDDLFTHYDLRDLILSEEWEVRPWARVVINGRFSYLVGNRDAPIRDGDLVVLMHPYVVAF